MVLRRSILFTACLALAGLACSGGEEPDQGGLKMSNGCVVSGARWASGGTLACPRSIADYCQNTVACPPPSWVDVVGYERSQGWPPMIWECDPYDIADLGWACGNGTDVFFVFDRSTGALLAAVESSQSAGGQTCLGGPAQIDYVRFCDNWFACFPNDAGWEAGRCYPEAGVEGGARD